MSRSNPLRNPLAESPLEDSFIRGSPLRDHPSAAGHPPPPPLASGGLTLGVPRGRGVASLASSSRRPNLDDAIRQTDSDALISRVSALRLGYLPPDPFSEEFLNRTVAPSKHLIHQPALSSVLGATHRHLTSTVPVPTPSAEKMGSPTSAFGYRLGGSDTQQPFSVPSPMSVGPTMKRPPLINIGTYLRCRSIDMLVERFLLQNHPLSNGKGIQIISLGAGSDSRYWRIMSNPQLSSKLSHYLELDFAELTKKKIQSIYKSDKLGQLVFEQETQPIPSSSTNEINTLRTKTYSIVPFDLRQFDSSTLTTKDQMFDSIISHIDLSLPTLLLFECVLAYIEPRASDKMIEWFGQKLERVAAIGYDICLSGENQDDVEKVSRFGQVMLQNLESRNLTLTGAKAYPTITSQKQRFLRLWKGGSTKSSATSLLQVWQDLDDREKKRISRLEGLDEVEELDMLLGHYCLTSASRHVDI